MWVVDEDMFTGYDGKEQSLESMWRYVADIQRDFASRVDWASKSEYLDGEHKPVLSIEEGLDIQAKADSCLTLHSNVSTLDKTTATVHYRYYKEASSQKEAKLTQKQNSACISIPKDAKKGDTIHIIVQAKANGHYGLVKYQQVIITIE